jgi:hypothetical protein
LINDTCQGLQQHVYPLTPTSPPGVLCCRQALDQAWRQGQEGTTGPTGENPRVCSCYGLVVAQQCSTRAASPVVSGSACGCPSEAPQGPSGPELPAALMCSRSFVPTCSATVATASRLRVPAQAVTAVACRCCYCRARLGPKEHPVQRVIRETRFVGHASASAGAAILLPVPSVVLYCSTAVPPRPPLLRCACCGVTTSVIIA